MKDIPVGKVLKWGAAATFVAGSFYLGDGNPLVGAKEIVLAVPAAVVSASFIFANFVLDSPAHAVVGLATCIVIHRGREKIRDFAEKMYNTSQNAAPAMENTGRFR